MLLLIYYSFINTFKITIRGQKPTFFPTFLAQTIILSLVYSMNHLHIRFRYIQQKEKKPTFIFIKTISYNAIKTSEKKDHLLNQPV